MKKRLYTSLIAMCLAIALPLAGCGGGGAKTENVVMTKSKGEQLSDLQKAYASGTLTPQEYERQRKKILDQP